MRTRAWLRLGVLLLAGCAAPPPSAYVGGGSGRGGVALGRDATGAACTALTDDGPGTRAIFCGGWNQPAARVARAGAAPHDLAHLIHRVSA